VSENKIKVFAETKSAEMILEDMENKIKKTYNKVPEHTLIGLTELGSPILAMTINNKIVSDVGYIIEHNSSGEKIIKLTNFN
jgi:hypothetical protein